ncbi:hypothetical protein VTL71DRAFT_3030 [Oculimacula yallundae]|uniref:Uncharacterized protein n=1 Tax=Oculimacula yallundae TaxID=86028 RepID=A0ABR4C624_9HELO
MWYKLPFPTASYARDIHIGTSLIDMEIALRYCLCFAGALFYGGRYLLVLLDEGSGGGGGWILEGRKGGWQGGQVEDFMFWTGVDSSMKIFAFAR